MPDKIPQNELEIKHAGLAIECGTLDILLNALVSQPVFVMPITRVVPNGAQVVRQWSVFVSARPSTKAPVYYATFLAAKAMGIAQTVGLIYPYSFIDPTALERGEALQEELTQCLCQVIKQSPRVSHILMPARYRLPDEWIWSVQSRTDQIHLNAQHWTVS